MHNTIRAVRHGPDEVVIGVGASLPQVITGLTHREIRALVDAGPLTPEQWPRIRTSKPPSDRWGDVVRHVARAVEAVMPPLPRLGMIGIHAASDCEATRAIHDAVAHLGQAVVTGVSELDRIEASLLLADREEATSDVRHACAPALVVLPALEVLAPSASRSWQSLAVPHLPVVFGADGFVVGPLVRGRDDPCTLCLDLHRTDHDRHWAGIAAQYDGCRADVVDPSPDLASHAAGVVANVVRGLACGRPLAPGTLVTAHAVDVRVEHRRWSRHPGCPRHGPRTS